MADPLTLLSLGGLAILGGEKGFSLIKLKFGRNGNGNGHGKSPSLPEIKLAIQESHASGIAEVRDAIRDGNGPVIDALGEIKTVNQAMLQQMTRMVTIQEMSSNGNGRRGYKRKRG